MIAEEPMKPVETSGWAWVEPVADLRLVKFEPPESVRAN